MYLHFVICYSPRMCIPRCCFSNSATERNLKLSWKSLLSYHPIPSFLFSFFLSILCLFCRPLLFSAVLLSFVNTIAHAVSCCRHFVADHGAESLLPSNCQSVHFMVHIPCSPFVRVPLAPALISLTPSITNNNKSNVHLFQLAVTVLLRLLDFRLRRGCVLRVVWVGCRTCCMQFSDWLFVLSLAFWNLIEWCSDDVFLKTNPEVSVAKSPSTKWNGIFPLGFGK